ncbi:uncharacterized protein LOC133827049 [Humulus lupulus]|uniref:uncharacterized protein LOC133827049 n=1 Tax=Humulus lupulus TaxID=3486 RepID=UPI002B413124|nr:uncharacterized protein LOC133827049 [Humulus lupulus]
MEVKCRFDCVSDVDDVYQKVTVKIVPRIDLRALADKLGGREVVKKALSPLSPMEPHDSCLIRVERRRHPMTGEFFDYIGGMMFKDGFLYKLVSTRSILAHIIEPTLDELEKFKQNGEKGFSSSPAENIKKLHFVKGTVDKLEGENVLIRADMKDLPAENYFVNVNELCKCFKLGDRVKVVSGAQKNSTGMVTKIGGHVLGIVQVFANDAVKSSEVVVKSSKREIHGKPMVSMTTKNVHRPNIVSKKGATMKADTEVEGAVILLPLSAMKSKKMWMSQSHTGTIYLTIFISQFYAIARSFKPVHTDFVFNSYGTRNSEASMPSRTPLHPTMTPMRDIGATQFDGGMRIPMHNQAWNPCVPVTPQSSVPILMEMFREGGSTSQPPMLEGANYPYWKTKMCAFLRVVDERVWMAVEDGWKCPTVVEDKVVKPKQMNLWTPEEMERANFNSKAMHALFNAVSTNQLKVIANSEIAKEAWEKLRIKNEGTDAVKKSRLRALAKAFENLSMEEEEIVAEFHVKLCDISNESYALGKTYSNAKLVRKVLGVLPRKFMSKVTSVEEMRNVEELDLDELIGSLQKYEMTLTRWKKGKKQKDSEKEKTDNSLAFVHKEEKKSISDMSDGFTDETLALLTKNYAKFLKRNYKKYFPGGKENVSRRNFGGNNKLTQQSGDKKNRGIQCRECDGFGHIQAECVNTLKKKKALAATWSDNDEEKSSSSSDGSDEEKQVVAFMAKSHQSMCSEEDGKSSLSDVDNEQKLESEKAGLQNTVKKLTKQLDEKDNEIYKLTADLIRAKQALEFIPPGTAAINQTLQLQKPYGDRTSIGYKMLYKKGGNLGIYDPSSSKSNEDKTPDDSLHNTLSLGFPDPSKQVSVSSGPTKLRFEGRKTVLVGQVQKERFVHICHFCNRRGHIRPRCYKLQTYLKAMIDCPNSFQQPNRFNGKLSYSEWKPKTNLGTNVGLVAHTSLSAFHEDQWYFDSGCSRHMTGNRNVLVNYKEGKKGAVTFGDGNKGQIFGKGDLVLNGVAPLTKVLYVKGLKANLISISQLCDNEYTVIEPATTAMLLAIKFYAIDPFLMSQTCGTIDWDYRLGHLNFRDLKRIVKLQVVREIPEMKVTRDRLCGPCQLGKQTKASHPPVNMLLTSCVLELMHVDLMGPMQNESLSDFLKEKSDTFGLFSALVLRLQNEKESKIRKVYRIRSDHGKEFENTVFSDFCDQLGIKHEFSAPKTPQQNGVVERKNRTLQEMARPAISATVIIFELARHRRPMNFGKEDPLTSVICTFLDVFLYVLNDREHLGKFDPRSDEGVFLGYSLNNRAYRVFNKRTRSVVESINIRFDDLENSEEPVADDEAPVLTTPAASEEQEAGPSSSNGDEEVTSALPKETQHAKLYKNGPPSWIQKAHPPDIVIGNPNATMVTRRKIQNLISFAFYLSHLEPKSVKDALLDEFWLATMQDEMFQFKRNDVWILVPLPDGANVVGTKWIFKNKSDEFGTVIRNKARLVAQGYNQVEGVDFVETFCSSCKVGIYPVTSCSSMPSKNKIASNGCKNCIFEWYLIDEIFVAQIYVDDIIFGSISESEVTRFVELMQSEFQMSLIGDLSYFLGLQIKQSEQGMFISQSKYTKSMLEKFGFTQVKHAHTSIGTTCKLNKDESGDPVDPTLYRSMIRSLLYLTASRLDISFSVGICAHYQANPKQSHLTAVKCIFKYLAGTVEFGLWYSCDTNMSLVGYGDFDWAESLDDRKSTSRGCFYIGKILVSWFSKKQHSISLSTAEAEYIVAGSCYTQLVWLNKMFTDYGYPQKSLTLFCDSTRAINISKTPSSTFKDQTH